MLAVHDGSFQGLIKACILKEVKGYFPVNEACLNDSCVSVNDFSMNELLIEWNWLYGTPRNVSSLEPAVDLALRHKRSSPELIFKVISQALMKGVDYVLTRSSSEARRFCSMISEVRDELRDAKMSMRFLREGDTLLGRYFFSHSIADLLINFYQKRFPDKNVIISNQERSYAIDGVSVKSMPLRIPVPVSNVQAPSSLTLNSFF